MTNKQYLIWNIIDMPDEEFAIFYCRGMECEDCPVEKLGIERYSECRDKLKEWLKMPKEVQDDE